MAANESLYTGYEQRRVLERWVLLPPPEVVSTAPNIFV
jgi:hypothetical protein